MKTTTPSCSALAQNGWNFGSLISSPATLPPMPAPRRPYFLTPSSSCSAARSGCCSATVAKATKRSGCAAHVSASLAFWIAHTCLARSRSALYQLGLMLRASTSMPCSSIACNRTATCVAVSRSGRSCDPPIFRPISASASGTAQCACTSTVFARLPLTTTSRRRPCARAGAAASTSQPTKAMPASAPAVVWRKSRRVVMAGLHRGSRCAHYTIARGRSLAMSTHPPLELSHTTLSEADALRFLEGHRIRLGSRTMDPKAQIVGEFVKSIRKPGYFPPLPELRQQLRTMVTLMDEPAPALERVEDVRIPGPAGEIPARVYAPRRGGAPLPMVAYFHGGGWVQGDLETHHGLCARLARHAGVLVVAVDYRLAPEHKFPAAV